MQKHIFDPKAFRRHRLPFLFCAMLPSFLLDGYFAYNLVVYKLNFFTSAEIRTFWDAAAPFFANLLLFKAPIIYAYFRYRVQRLASYVLIEDKQVVYRRNKLALFAKMDYGYAYHDDFYFRNLAGISRRKNGSIAVCGDIPVLRKYPGIEAVYRQWKKKHAVIPAYYTDMDSIFHELQKHGQQNS